MTEPEQPRCRNGVCVRMSPGLCPACAYRLAGWVRDLPELWVRMHLRLPRQQSTGEVVSGSSAPPLPLTLDIVSFVGPAAGQDRTHLDRGDRRSGPVQDGTEPMLSQLAEWVRLVREERSVGDPHPVPAPRRPDAPFGPETLADARDRAAETAGHRHAAAVFGFLERHHSWIVAQPWSDEYAQEVHDVWHRANTLAGAWDGRPEHMAGVPCSRCDLMALYRRPGDAGRTCDVRAGGCGHWMSDEEYERWTGLGAAYVRQEGIQPPLPEEREHLDPVTLALYRARDATGHDQPCECERCAEAAHWAKEAAG